MSGQMDNAMYYGALPVTFQRACVLRNNMTKPELRLWSRLSKRQLIVRFKAQHPIDIFIADFYCHPAKLVVEIDGDSHLTSDQKEWDEGRTAVLESFNLEIIRFTNDEVLTNIEFVVDQIKLVVSERLRFLESAD